MIPTLLWRCPLCSGDGTLAHSTRRLRPDRLRCSRCGAEWRVRRILADDYYLKVVKGRSDVGRERSLREWYDLMKQNVRLVPVADSPIRLRPGELVYLVSRAADLTAEASDPLFFPARRPIDGVRLDKRTVEGAVVGRGRLVLTGQRLAWQSNGEVYSFPLDRVNSVYALLDYGVALMVGMRLYIVCLLEESPLRWINHMALVAQQVEKETGHRIATSHY